MDAESFSGVTLQADGPSRVPELVAKVKEMGLKVDEQERRSLLEGRDLQRLPLKKLFASRHVPVFIYLYILEFKRG